MSSSIGEPQQRAPSFNPAAPAFTPAPNPFQTSHSMAAVSENVVCGSLMPASGSAAREDSPEVLYRQVAPGVFVPNFERSPLSDSGPIQMKGGDVETHAMNMELPIEPSTKVQLQQPVTPNKDAGNTPAGRYTQSIFPNAIAAPAVSTPDGAGTYAHQDEETGLLFPLSQRANGLDGKLVQQALRKTLTAEELAKHLQHTMSLYPGFAASSYKGEAMQLLGEAALTHSQYPEHHGGTAFPPQGIPHGGMQYDPLYGFYSPMSPYIMELPQQHQLQSRGFSTPPTAPRAMVIASESRQPQPRYSGPSQYTGAMGSPLQDSNNVQTPQFTPQHHRGSKRTSSVRHVKRMDQGPEASPADIYPDDAFVNPDGPPVLGISESQHRQISDGGLRRPNPQLPMQLQLNLEANDSKAWPTPAEALKLEQPILPPPTFQHYHANFAEKHKEKAKMNAYQIPQHAHVTKEPTNLNALQAESTDTRSSAETESSTDTESSSSNSISILVEYGASNPLVPDSRPLTPRQVDCSRYGLKFFGVGYMDHWDPDYTQGEEKCESKGVAWLNKPLRVRPRDHEGWGGLKWGEAMGWSQPVQKQ